MTPSPVIVLALAVPTATAAPAARGAAVSVP